MTIINIISAFSLAVIALVLIRVSLTLADISAHFTAVNSVKENSGKLNQESASPVQAAQLPGQELGPDDSEIAAVIAIASRAFTRTV